MQPVDIALETALLVLRNGGSTAVADRSFADILKGCGQQGFAAVWRLDFIAAVHEGADRPSAVVRSVGPIGINLVRASEAVVLGQRAACGGLGVEVLAAELGRIKDTPSPYNRWLMMAAAAAAAGCFTQILGGGWTSFVIAFVAAGAGQFLRSLLQARAVPAAAVTFVCGLASGVIASLALRQGLSPAEPETLLGSIIYLVPGLPLINGFVDVFTHRYLLIGAERILNAAFLFVVLSIAIAFARALLL